MSFIKTSTRGRWVFEGVQITGDIYRTAAKQILEGLVRVGSMKLDPGFSTEEEAELRVISTRLHAIAEHLEENNEIETPAPFKAIPR